MMQSKDHLWCGKRINHDELVIKLKDARSEFSKSLTCSLSRSKLILLLDHFSKALKKQTFLIDNLTSSLITQGLSKEDAREAILEVSIFCAKENIECKIKKELGKDENFDLERASWEIDLFEGWHPLGVLAHVTPGNSPALSFLAIVEGLIAGNVNLLKLSSNDSDFTIKSLEWLIENDLTGSIKEKCYVFKISSKEKELLKAILSNCDGLSAWGSEATILELKSMIPSQARFIPWGHKISFAIIDESKISNENVLKALAFDAINFEQQACSSPQCLYLITEEKEKVYELAKNLLPYVEQKSNTIAYPELDLQTQAEITNTSEMLRLDSIMGQGQIFEDKKLRSRLMVELSSDLKPSPLYRSLWIKPISKDEITKTLFPLRQYLQTAGLAASEKEIVSIANSLLDAGVTRITPVGKMLTSYTGEPHDGEYALLRYMKRVRVEIEGLDGIFRLSDFEDIKDRELSQKHAKKVMSKTDFQNQDINKDFAHLFFRSGGSSGNSTLSTFSYKSYHRQMQAAAEGLLAAGLSPKVDRVANLFFGGGLYGGFLSFYTILEKLDAIQLPIAAYDDLKFVGNTIVENNINTIMGMPSYIIQLFTDNEEIFSKNKVVKKIYFGGEHFAKNQREWLQDKFDIDIIRSACYGSVDAGPLGFQCPKSDGSIHHLNHNIHSLEILELDRDRAVSGDQVGRLVFTSRARESLRVERYDLGDVGRWVIEECSCGRKSPRFELLGRIGDIFRAAGTFLNFQKFERIFEEEFSYNGEFQIIIENDEMIDKLTIVLDEKFKSSLQFENIISLYQDLNEAINKEKTLQFSLKWINSMKFEKSKNSGKLFRVLDKRQ